MRIWSDSTPLDGLIKGVVRVEYAALRVLCGDDRVSVAGMQFSRVELAKALPRVGAGLAKVYVQRGSTLAEVPADTYYPCTHHQGGRRDMSIRIRIVGVFAGGRASALVAEDPGLTPSRTDPGHIA